MRRKRVHIWDLSNPSQGMFLVAAVLAFVGGMLAGFVLTDHIGLPSQIQFHIQPDAPVTLLRLSGLLWSHYRWLLVASLMAMTALGLFTLYPLVFLRGVLIGFSFSCLFSHGMYSFVLLRFLCTVVLTVTPLLVCASCGVKRAFTELHRSGEESLLDHPGFPLLMLLISFALSFLCSCAELWLVPGFVSYIQPVT